MDYCAEIRGLMAEGNKLHIAAETHKKERGRDREHRLLEIEGNQLVYQADELRRQAAREFAALNGWRWTERLFSAETLARGGTHSSPGWCYEPRLFDHPLFFRELARPYRAAAIVGQPYDTTPADARELAAKLGLALHVPPKETASWWYPGWTRFFCFTRPQTERVRFLPEQMEAAREKDELESGTREAKEQSR